MSTINVCIKSDLSGLGEVVQDSSSDAEGLRALINYLEACASGCGEASIDVQTSASDPVAAAGTVTCASISADDTVTVGSVTFTAKSSPAGETQFEIDGDDDADATALGAAINAHSTLSKVVVATVADNVVTVTSRVKGVVGNHLVLDSSNGTRLAVTEFAGGTGGATTTAVTYRCGL